VRGAIFVALCWCAGCRCGPPPSNVDEQPLRVMPAALDFGTVWVGASKTLSVDVSNPNLVSVSVSASAAAPFNAAGFELGAGADLMEPVTFTPSGAGPFSGVVVFGDAGVNVSGTGQQPPPCVPDGCNTSAFDLDAGACVKHALPDGTDCTASSACFVQASCQSGICIGTQTTCDDGNPCTTDVCGVSGCGHVDGVLACPGSTNPCLSPSCDPDAGCGFAPVPDGTSCGTRDCMSAQVCINAACVTRAAPQNQACADVVAGVPAGNGTADGVGRNARFGWAMRLAVDAANNVWVIDQQNHLLRKVTPAGAVTTVAGHAPAMSFSLPVDGFGSNAFLSNPSEIAVDRAGEIVFWDSGLWRKASPAGLITSWIGVPSASGFSVMDGIGAAARVSVALGLTVGPGGDLFSFEREPLAVNFLVRHISPLGEILTVDSYSASMSAGLDIAWSQGAFFFVDIAQGVMRRDGNGTTVFWSGSGISRVAAAPSGEVAIVANTAAVIVLDADGGLRTSWTGHDEVSDIAWYGPGRWVAAEGFVGARLVVISEDGGASVLAGPDFPLHVQDGPVATSGLTRPGGIAVGPAGDIFVSDFGGVRRIANGEIVTWWVGPNYGFDLAILSDGEIMAASGVIFDILGPDAGVAFAPDAGCYAVAARGMQLAATCADGIHQWNGGSFIPAGITYGDVAFDDDGGVYVTFDNGGNAQIDDISAAGGQTQLAAVPVTAGGVPRLARAPGGDLFLVDGNHDITRITPAGSVTTVATLADAPTNIAVEDGGTLLVTVPDAVLRVHP
jgi:hypothetical protein